jgi:hypothetical protein
MSMYDGSYAQVAAQRTEDRQAAAARDEDRTAPERARQERAVEINMPGVIHGAAHSPAARAANHAADEASQARRATVAQARAGTPAPPARKPRRINTPATPEAAPPAKGLTPLESAVEALVAAHTCGAVIDAAWAAAPRLFNPNQPRA